MANTSKRRDYSLTGPENRKAEEKGLAAAEWYTCPIPRQRLKELMKRKDGPAIRDTLIWFAALIGLGVAAYYSWGTWWAIPAFFLYGVVYALPGNSRWHECGHGTAFKTPWMNEVLYQISSFMCLFPATLGDGAMPDIIPTPLSSAAIPRLSPRGRQSGASYSWKFFRLHGGPRDLKRVILHFFGKMDKEEESYIPVSERRKVCWEARVWVFIFLAVIASCVYMQSILPAMFIGLPTFYGSSGFSLPGLFNIWV